MYIDFLQYFSWWTYGFTVILYTAMVVSGEFWQKDRLIFSKQNAKPLSEIVTIHLAFLAVLLGVSKLLPSIYFRLPGWVLGGTITRSHLDFFFVVLMVIMQFIERRWIYVPREEDIATAGEKLSE